jgi:O-antigen biosynthesis protein
MSISDIVCFNVYLESDDAFEAYLPRLHNLAGNKPVMMTEMGLDSSRHGETNQARLLASQIARVYAAGFAGTFVFSWTDEWYRGGSEITDWDFGLTTRWRKPKKALSAVRSAFEQAPFPDGLAWPKMSVVVCTYNGSRTIRDCCEGLAELDYPDFEVIVVDDGSKDQTAELVEPYGFRLIRTNNRGLSAARNTGMEAATGEIIAYLDDDARADPQWLRYLAYGFLTTDHAAIGGPNIAPDDGRIAQCVANAPGGPMHVLLTDTVAEHIPGCNFAVRRSCLAQIGGFDRRFRVAGDDVDACWRLQDAGWTIGYAPAAMVWHHRRKSVKTYWRQQVGYGRAEALLEDKWPERYNTLGHVSWKGRIYGAGPTRSLPSFRARVYGGVWGTAPFQSIYEPAGNGIASLPLMPEFQLLTGFLAALSLLGILWTPLLVGALPLLALALGVQALQAWLSASRSTFDRRDGFGRRRLVALTAALHILQPTARLWGRLRHGLTLWRLGARAHPKGVPGHVSPAVPRSRAISLWRETWTMPETVLTALLNRVKRHGLLGRAGGQFDPWDVQVCAGLLGCARVRMAVEEHGQGRQLLRFRAWPVPSLPGMIFIAMMSALSAAAALSAAWIASLCLAVLVGLCLISMVRDLSSSMGAMLAALRSLDG